ncbi:MAG: ATP-binding protein, partial [Bacillota bacterium]
GVMIIGIDGNSKITEVNQKSCQVLGYSKQELCGKDWSDFLAREEVKRAKDIFAEAPAGQSSLINYGQNEVLTRSGAKRKIIWTSRVLKDETGNIKRILSSGLDVTRSSLLKEKLEYNRLQVEFFANLSHELKTPLNLIFSALKVADSYQENNLAPEVYQDLNNYTEIIRQNSNRLLRLVNNLIDITKLDSNSFDLNLKNTDLVQLLEDIIDSVRSHIETEDRILKFNSKLDKKVVACDPFNIERIILNLISNALKFTEIGDEIIINLAQTEEQVLIIVKDTGIGIPKEKQEMIFDRFCQVDKSFNRANEGSGIGLAIVKSLVELHDGELELDSRAGEYTEFAIKLPDKQLKMGNREEQKSSCAKLDMIDRVDIEFADLYNLE